MSINSVADIVSTCKTLSALEGIDSVLEEDNGYSILSACGLSTLADVDDNLVEKVEHIELSASYYLMFETGQFNKSAVSTLAKNNISVEKLSDSFPEGAYGLNTDKFTILFYQ